MPVMIASAQRRGIEVEGRNEAKLRIPSWFREAVLLGKYWKESGLLGRLEEVVRVTWGRMGQYEVSDFVLLLNSYSLSGARSLADFYGAIGSVPEVLMSGWGRSGCAVASTLSRFLATLDCMAVQALRGLIKQDLERQGLCVEARDWAI